MKIRRNGSPRARLVDDVQAFPASTQSLVDVALMFASAAHGAVGQKRSYTNEPYIVHPKAVADTLEALGFDDIVISAALLHDVIEDTHHTQETLLETFPSVVVGLVVEMTDVTTKEDGSRKQRKEIELQRWAKATYTAKSIKLADLKDNTRSILEYDQDFAQTYAAEVRELLQVLKGGNSQLWQEVNALIENYYYAQDVLLRTSPFRRTSLCCKDGTAFLRFKQIDGGLKFSVEKPADMTAANFGNVATVSDVCRVSPNYELIVNDEILPDYKVIV